MYWSFRGGIKLYLNKINFGFFFLDNRKYILNIGIMSY